MLRAATHEAELAGERISLTPIEFMLLEALMQREGHVVRKEVLAEIGWGGDTHFNEGTLYVFMGSLRAKLHAPDRADLLHTIRGVGYMLKSVAA